MKTPQTEGRKMIAAFLKERRIELNLSCDDLAEATGLNRSTIWRIEEGRFSPSLDVLLAISTALSCYFFIEAKDSPTQAAEWMRDRWGKRSEN